MQQFLKRVRLFSLVGIVLLLPILVSYVYFDPFKVIKNYTDYSYSYIATNRDVISTTMFIRNYPKYHYNSFILGSSRTMGFKPKTWQKYLTNKDTTFMFDASGETIFGIYTKLKYLDEMEIKINNVLIILCRTSTFLENKTMHLFVKHPAVSKESHLFFQMQFFKAYLNPKFLFYLYTYKISKTYTPAMEGYIENRKITYDTLTNEISIIDQEAEITNFPAEYYAKRKDIFYARTKEKIDPVPRINKEYLWMLKEIKEILRKNKTSFKVVLSPLYEQIKFNPTDLKLLKEVFGDNLYDFTGKNAFTDNQTNYYETNHFRPIVGDSIFKVIYKNK